MKRKYIPIITRKESRKLAIDEICYIYRSNRKLMFETDSGLIHSYDKIDEIEQYLGPNFYRCMAGCIVNLARIKDMKDLTVIFDNDKIYKPGKESYQRIKRKYNAYLVRLLLHDDFLMDDDSER